MLLIIAAVLQISSPSARPSDADVIAAYRKLDGYAVVDRYAAASADVEACGALGYEAYRSTLTSELADVWRSINATDPIPFTDFLERYNAVMDRIDRENEAEVAVASTSKAAFDVFKNNMSRRCDALAIDHPLWLERKRSTSVDWMFAWEGIEQNLLGETGSAVSNVD